MSGLSTCRDCGQWIYWGVVEGMDGSQRNVPYSDSKQTTLHWEDCANQDYVTDSIGNSYRVTKCSTCKHSVYWETTARGKRRPMDVFVDEDTGEFEAAGVCHFETCVGQRTGGNFRNGDSYSGASRKSESAESTSESHEEIKSFEQQKLAPYLGVLQLTWPCTSVEVTQAFRRLALERHPDMGGSDQAFIALKSAYDHARKLINA